MSAITTHVLDLSTGHPAAGIDVLLEFESADRWMRVGHGSTDADGRLRTLMPPGALLEPGAYRLTFHTKPYFEKAGARTFFPHVVIVFEAVSGEPHYHVPLLLSPFGYSTYRGS
jgi:5-hydroxyisourate hydrolase